MLSVNVCGYVNTGRSAVSDWLYSHENVVRFPNQEGRYWRHPGGLEWLYRRAVSTGLTDADLSKFRDLVLGRISASTAATWIKPYEADYCNEDGQWAQRVFGPVLLEAVDDFIASAAAIDAVRRKAIGSDAASKEFLGLSRTFGSTLSKALAGERAEARCAYANLFHAYHAQYAAQFFDQFAIVIVDRDPRDQYADLRARQLTAANTFAAFQTEFLKHRTNAFVPPARPREVEMKEVGGNRVLYVFFEDFVLQPSYRDALRDLLGLRSPSPNSPDPSGFDPTRSSRNIRIFEAFADEMEDRDPALERFFFER